MATTKQQVNGLQVAAIPAGTAGADLVAALNQRFRQLSLATVTVAPVSKSPASGSTVSSSTATGNAAVFTITPAAGPAFTPDLSQSLFQQVILTANSTLTGPIGTPTDGATQWTLIVDNPNAAAFTLTPDPAKYFLNFQITVAPNTRAQIIWTNDQNDYNSVAGSSFNGSIPPSS